MKENIEDSERDKKRKSKEKKLVVDGNVSYILGLSHKKSLILLTLNISRFLKTICEETKNGR